MEAKHVLSGYLYIWPYAFLNFLLSSAFILKSSTSTSLRCICTFSCYWSLEIHKCIRDIDGDSEFCCASRALKSWSCLVGIYILSEKWEFFQCSKHCLWQTFWFSHYSEDVNNAHHLLSVSLAFCKKRLLVCIRWIMEESGASNSLKRKN